MEYFEISGWHDDSSKIEVWLDELLIAGWHGIWRTMKFSGAESRI